MIHWIKYNRMEAAVVTALLLILVASGYAIGAALAGKEEERRTFMQGCLDDGRKEYECVAMWRAGDPAVTVVVR